MRGLSVLVITFVLPVVGFAQEIEVEKLVGPSGVIDHNQIDLTVIRALEVAYEPGHIKQAAESACNNQHADLTLQLAYGKDANGKKLTFEDQLSIQQTLQECIEKLQIAGKELNDAVGRVGGEPVIELTGFPVIIGKEDLRPGMSGKNIVYLELCGLPRTIWLEYGPDSYEQIFMDYAPPVDIDGFKFQYTQTDNSSCSSLPNDSDGWQADHNWRPTRGASLDRQLAMMVGTSNLSAGAKLREQIMTSGLTGRMVCSPNSVDVGGGYRSVCNVKSLEILWGDGTLFFRMEGQRNTWSGSAPFARELR